MTEDHPLKAWRAKRGLTQEALGDAVGVGASQISMIEAGKRGPSIEVAAKIVRVSKGAIPLEVLLPGLAG
jgi:transcriptional regulator with XRE-family HTH domain